MRYRSPVTSSHRTIPYFKHVARLGRITSIRGYRYNATVKSEGNPLRLTGCERVMVYGENGSARFAGVCWGYGGESPHALRDLLMACGFHQEQADTYAFGLHRSDKPGTDWLINVNGDGTTVLVKGHYGYKAA